MTLLHRLVYHSLNEIDLDPTAMEWEIDRILETSQRRNAPAGVTGALIYNDGVFGQVLEGPLDAVEDTFERIQNDPRHRDTTILQFGPVPERLFAGWSMGYVGAAAHAPAASLPDLRAVGGGAMLDALHALAHRGEVRRRVAA